MTKKSADEIRVSWTRVEVIAAGRSLIAASSILGAVTDQYAHTGSFSVGAVIHVANIVDEVIEKLGLAEIVVEIPDVPF